MADTTDKGQELIEEANAEYEDHKEAQSEILDDISEDHGGELIQTKCGITPQHTVDLEVDLNGEFIDAMADIEELTERIERGDKTASGTSEVMDKAARLLGDVVEQSEWDKDLFYEVYKQNDPSALGEMFRNVGESIRKERKRKQEGTGSFRKQ